MRQGYSVDFLQEKIELWTKDSLMDNLVTNCKEVEKLSIFIAIEYQKIN